ncbi:MAG TPA: hypothetical protein VH502_08850, partial [Actinoplanes sp.]
MNSYGDGSGRVGGAGGNGSARGRAQVGRAQVPGPPGGQADDGYPQHRAAVGPGGFPSGGPTPGAGPGGWPVHDG